MKYCAKNIDTERTNKNPSPQTSKNKREPNAKNKEEAEEENPEKDSRSSWYIELKRLFFFPRKMRNIKWLHLQHRDSLLSFLLESFSHLGIPEVSRYSNRRRKKGKKRYAYFQLQDPKWNFLLAKFTSLSYLALVVERYRLHVQIKHFMHGDASLSLHPCNVTHHGNPDSLSPGL